MKILKNISVRSLEILFLLIEISVFLILLFTKGFVFSIVMLFIYVCIRILLSSFRNPIPRKVGFRNITRRIDNTVLIIIGSMVGTALISGSLVLGNSLDRTFLVSVENQIGELDLVISWDFKQLVDTPINYIDKSEYEKIKNTIPNDKVDGVLPLLSLYITPQKLDSNGKAVLNAYNVELNGIELDSLSKFGKNPQKFDAISTDKIIISKTLAERLELKVNDTVRIKYGEIEMNFVVERIMDDKGIIGGSKIIANLKDITSKLGLPEESYNTIYISAPGGVEPDNYKGEEFKKTIDDSLKNYSSDLLDLRTSEFKQQALDGYGLKFFSQIFTVLSFFGVFSGILLIVNLYMMLASERKYEMGILRVIALTRGQLTKTFVYEGFLYSIISSLVGAMFGVLIGFVLIKILGTTINSLFKTVADGYTPFEFTFDVKPQSIIIAFVVGALITIFTALFASMNISKLNIVAAIRGYDEEKKQKLSIRWIINTLLNLVFLGFSFLSLILSLSIRSIMTSLRDTTRNTDPDNPLVTMSDKDFNDSIDRNMAFMLYLGFILTVIFGVALVNRLVKMIFKKDISKITITIGCILNILLSSFMTKFDSIGNTLNQEGYGGIVMFFISGVVLVVSLVFILTYNLNIFTSIFTLISKPFKKLQPIFKISMRYPYENKSRTGFTLVMFALVIYLIAYISMMKVTMKVQNDQSLEQTMGGYQVMVYPSNDNSYDQLNTISNKIESYTNTQDVALINTALITLPEYKYKDLNQYIEQGPVFEQYGAEDAFRTYLESFPDDFLLKNDMKLKSRSEVYESDKEAWETIVKDSSKVILGTTFTYAQYGIVPDIKIGDKIQISDVFSDKTSEKEVIGIVESDSMGMSIPIYNYIVTSNSYLSQNFDDNYIQKYSQSTFLVSFKDTSNLSKDSKEIKKLLIDENISTIYELSEINRTTMKFLDVIIGMFQGFLAFSLIVGTSGLAIIITRSVNERRQQIGMLRSLGFQRWMVLASFIVESTFITLLGITVGISMGTIGALNAFYVAFKDQPDVHPVFPIGEIVFICVSVYLASILFSIFPSIKASRLSPVEATNYPE